MFVTIWLLSPSTVSFAKGWFRGCAAPGAAKLLGQLQAGAAPAACPDVEQLQFISFSRLDQFSKSRFGVKSRGMQDVKALIFLGVRKVCWFCVWVFFLLFKARIRMELQSVSETWLQSGLELWVLLRLEPKCRKVRR